MAGGDNSLSGFVYEPADVFGVDLLADEDSPQDVLHILPSRGRFYSVIKPMNRFNSELTKADVVVLTLPLTKQTLHMMDNHRLSLMKGGAILVNIARGAIVDINALLLHINRIGGAVLDVCEEEPLDEKSQLWDNKNIILTPHNSFVGDGNKERLNSIIFNNLL